MAVVSRPLPHPHDTPDRGSPSASGAWRSAWQSGVAHASLCSGPSALNSRRPPLRLGPNCVAPAGTPPPYSRNARPQPPAPPTASGRRRFWPCAPRARGSERSRRREPATTSHTCSLLASPTSGCAYGCALLYPVSLMSPWGNGPTYEPSPSPFLPPADVPVPPLAITPSRMVPTPLVSCSCPERCRQC